MQPLTFEQSTVLKRVVVVADRAHDGSLQLQVPFMYGPWTVAISTLI